MIYLYKEITPNKDNFNVNYFKDFSKYLTFLNTYLVKTISNDKYTINTNILRLKIDETLTAGILDTITYIVNVEGDYKRCYYVNSFNYQSGYAVFTLSIDTWATYIYKASFKNIRLIESTGLFKVGVLPHDEILPYRYKDLQVNFLNSQPYIAYLDNSQEIANNEVYIVFSMKYNIYQTQDGAVSKIGLFAITVRDIKTAFVNAGTSDANKLSLSKVNDLEVVARVISGIYGIGSGGALKCEVINAWLLPSSLVNFNQYYNQTIYCRTGTEYNSNNITINVKSIFANISFVTYRIGNRFINYNPRLLNIFGTKGLGLQLINTENPTTYFKVNLSYETINIVAGQGNNEKDITSAFAIAITHNSGDISPQRNMATALNKIVSLLSGTVGLAGGIAGAVAGNPLALLGGGMSVAKTATGLVNESMQKSIGQQVGTGGGFAIFNKAQTFGEDYTSNCQQPLANPICLVSFNTIATLNTQYNVELKALIYDNAMPSNTDNLYELPYNVVYNANFYIKASCEVSGVNIDACNFIENKLLNGIEIVNYLT